MKSTTFISIANEIRESQEYGGIQFSNGSKVHVLFLEWHISVKLQRFA